MDLRKQLLAEAARLEQKARQIREAAKVLDGKEPLVLKPRRGLSRRNRKRERHGHRATCKQCRRGFLSYVQRYKSADAGPHCSGKCRAKARRERLAQAVVLDTVLPIGRLKPTRPGSVVLIPGDGVSKGL